MYLEAGVPLVWIIEPIRRVVTLYQPGRRPEFFTEDSEITAEPHIPGFRTGVSRLFGAGP